jgi:DNA processing protein
MSEASAGGRASADARWLVALGSLPGMGPARLRLVLDGRDAEQAWHEVRVGFIGVPEALRVSWASAARRIDVDARWAEHRTLGVQVLQPGVTGWPSVLDDDPEPPALLFVRGDPSVLEGPRVAIVGTRRCSYTGREVARELGRDLASAGVRVVSGLALGIDGAAHQGALAAGGPPVGVVGTGLDVVYPRRHEQLWGDVGRAGVLLTEAPLGAVAERWRFPARNRIIAALADVVVVVESHATGGSMHTVDAAIERGRLVMAVPGSVRSPAAAGTNALLAAGSPPVRDATDVLVALGLDPVVQQRVAPRPPEGDAGRVLAAVGWEPATLEQVADRLDAPLGPVAARLAELEGGGWLRQQAGWYERLR